MTKMRVPVFGLSEGLIELAPDDAHYVRTVHHLRERDSFVVFDPEQVLQADATIVSASRGHVRCQVSNLLHATCVPSVAA